MVLMVRRRGQGAQEMRSLPCFLECAGFGFSSRSPDSFCAGPRGADRILERHHPTGVSGGWPSAARPAPFLRRGKWPPGGDPAFLAPGKREWPPTPPQHSRQQAAEDLPWIIKRFATCADMIGRSAYKALVAIFNRQCEVSEGKAWKGHPLSGTQEPWVAPFTSKGKSNRGSTRRTARTLRLFPAAACMQQARLLSYTLFRSTPTVEATTHG